MSNRYSKIVLLSGKAHPDLAEKVSKAVGIPLSRVDSGKFANGETSVEIKETIRGADAYVIQTICATDENSLNDSVMELLVMVSALRGSSADRINAVLPMYGYARQDKKDKSRASISARLFGDLLVAAGIDRVITVDLHSSQIQGFLNKPMDNLYTEDLLTDHIKRSLPAWQAAYPGAALVVVSPDAGGAKRASRVATKLGIDVDCAIISKERLKANEVSSMRLVGSVRDRIAIIVDDMADTCGTLIKAVETVKAEGAIQVHAYVAHGVFSGPAIDRINSCEGLSSVVCTNTLPQAAKQKRCSKLDVVDVSTLLAAAINCCYNHTSISALFTRFSGDYKEFCHRASRSNSFHGNNTNNAETGRGLSARAEAAKKLLDIDRDSLERSCDSDAEEK